MLEIIEAIIFVFAMSISNVIDAIASVIRCGRKNKHE
jgi:hypothetical protein